MTEVYNKNTELNFAISYNKLKEQQSSSWINEEWLKCCISLLEITPYLDFRSEIVALLPYKKQETICTLVLFKDYIQIIDQSSLMVINAWLQSFNLDYEHYRELYLSAHPHKTYTIPVSNGHFSLFPLENIQHSTTIWLNAGQIDALDKQNYHTRITLHNGLFLDVTKQIPSLEQHILRAIHCLLLFRPIQELSNTIITQPTNLLEYLKLPSTVITRKVTRLLPFTLNAKEENRFRLNYFGMTQEYQRYLEQKQQKYPFL